MTSAYLERRLRTLAEVEAIVGNKHWPSPRQRQVDAARDIGKRRAIMHNFYGGLISHEIAARQLRETGMFEAEIKADLNRKRAIS